MNNQADNKRIAKNAVMLYMRMFLTMVVGIYTGRVVLDVLGVQDYGIYGLVSGVIYVFNFLNASMSGATSRFITFELGRGDQKRLRATFNSAFMVHVGIALIVLVLGETVGLWFLCNKLVIPADRMYAAHWVYQLSIAGAMLGITQVPYGACMIAHENMSIYAYVKLLDITLKLLIVFLLQIGNFDKLIFYAILGFMVSVVIRMINRIYCIRHYQESRLQWGYSREILKPMLSFTGWDMYGNMCVTVANQGFSFLINMFFGVLYNAAANVANTLHGVILGFSGTVSQAFRPQITKNYATGNYARMQTILGNSIKYTLILYQLFAVPLFIEVDYVLQLWLVEVPAYAALFCRLLIIGSLFSFTISDTNAGIHATGNIKRISFISGSFYLLQLPLLYAAYRLTSGHPEMAYLVSNFIMAVVMLVNWGILKKQVPQLSIRYIARNFVIAIIAAGAALLPVLPLVIFLPDSFLRLSLVCICYPPAIAAVTYWWVFDHETRQLTLNYVKTKLHRP